MRSTAAEQADAPVRGRRPRVGLVLGGGGLTGTAFHAGVLTALAEAGWDARTADVIVGTSAGSTSAALLRAGFPPADYVPRVCDQQLSAQGTKVLAGLGPLRPTARQGPTRPVPASLGLAGSVLRRPWRYRPGVLAAALLPAGTAPVDPGAASLSNLFTTWPSAPTWICTVRLSDGARVVFGRDATAPVGQAVAASCAIPGYFEPVPIDGQRYVDGGMWSTHNADLLAGQGLDVVIVSAPMSTADLFAAEPGNALRVPIRHSLDREVAGLRRAGVRVVTIQPDAGLRRLMGTNSMVMSKRPAVAMATRAHVADQVRTSTLFGGVLPARDA